MESKPVWQSKTIISAIATALVTIFNEPVQQYISQHPGIASTVISGAFLILRFLTNTSIEIPFKK